MDWVAVGLLLSGIINWFLAISANLRGENDKAAYHAVSWWGCFIMSYLICR
jgi:hypothetical protein